MAETHTNIRDNSVRLKRNVSKIAFRTTEKVMRTIGRSEETKDEILDHYVMLVNKQQLQMQKLQRDMKDYLSALKALSISQKAFFNSLYEVYDNDWAGKDVISSCSQRNQLLHDDIFARFQAEVTEALQEHLIEYHNCKFKVEKRGRKLVDYDAARRSLQSLQLAKKPDRPKIDRAKEHVRQTRETYEELNNNLHEQLPALYDSRLPLCVNTFSSICDSERQFFTEAAEMRSKLNSVLLNLKSAYDAGEYRIQRMHPPLDNGRVPPTSPGVTGSPPLKIRSSSTRSSSSVTKTNGETPLPPRSPGEGSHGSPGSDPSTHEYVNLQVGVPDVVKPVSEEEETGNGDSKQSSGSKKTDDDMYLMPNVNREELGYIMASDPILPRNKGSVGVAQPKPSPRSQMFRNTSEVKECRPPIPKPLPRTLSAPLGDRPLYLGQRKPPQGNWRVPKNQHTDVMLRSNHNKPPRQTVSLHRHREPLHRARPASMSVASAAAGVSDKDAEDLHTKDDGSGNPDPKKSATMNKLWAGTMMSRQKHKEKPPSDQGGKHKGFLGFKGFKKHAKNGKTPMTPPSSPTIVEEKQFPDKAKAVAATAVIAMTAEKENEDPASRAAEVQPEKAENFPPDAAPIVSQEKERKKAPPPPVPDMTKQEVSEESDTGSEDMDDMFAKYGGPGQENNPERTKDNAAPEKEQDAITDDEDDGPAMITEPDPEPNFNHSVEVEATIEKLHVQNEPVYSRPVRAVSDADNFSDRIQNKKPDVESMFPGVHEETDIVFSQERSKASLHDPFHEEKIPAESMDSASSGSSVKDLFGSKPFKTVLDDKEENPEVFRSPEKVSEDHDDITPSGSTVPNVQGAVVSGGGAMQEGKQQHDLQQSAQVNEPTHSHENETLQKKTNMPPMERGSSDMDDVATHEALPQNVDVMSSLPTSLTEDTPEATANETLAAVNDALAAKIDELIPEIKPLKVDLSDEEDSESENERHRRLGMSSISTNEVEDLRAYKQESDSSDEEPTLVEKYTDGNDAKKEFDKPEPQSPPMHHKPNGDSATIQPIYEEPPNEEDLPSYKKPTEKPEPPPPRSPTKSDDSYKYLDLPPSYLYSVQALYVYRSTDEDELSFEKGEIIHIVTHPDPEEQDDGWQMGIRQKDWEEKSDLESCMGVFPENFTKKIQL